MTSRGGSLPAQRFDKFRSLIKFKMGIRGFSQHLSFKRGGASPGIPPEQLFPNGESDFCSFWFIPGFGLAANIILWVNGYPKSI